MTETPTHQETCHVCGKPFAQRDLVPGGAVREVIANEIRKDHPQWSPECFICRSDLNDLRTRHVHSLLESEKGDITHLEREVLESLREHELLAKNVEVEIRDDWTLGERMADRMAEFGGSWRFLMVFGIFLSLWILMNSLVLLWRRRYEFARVTAFVAVASVVAGWGVAQYPDFLPGTATIDQAAGARAALVGLLVVFGLAVVTVVPSLAYLFSMSRSGASTGTTHPLPPRRRP